MALNEEPQIGLDASTTSSVTRQPMLDDLTRRARTFDLQLAHKQTHHSDREKALGFVDMKMIDRIGVGKNKTFGVAEVNFIK